MSFTARLDGQCAAGDRIRPGDEIERTDQPGEYVHADCVEDYEAGVTDNVSKRPVCPDCWQTTAANGTCGCDD